MIGFTTPGGPALSPEMAATLNAVACASLQTLPEIARTRALAPKHTRSDLEQAEGLGYVERRGEGKKTEWHLTKTGRVLLNG